MPSNKFFAIWILFLLFMGIFPVQVNASSPIIVRITTDSSQNYSVLIYYKQNENAQTEEGGGSFEHGTENFTIGGILIHVDVWPISLGTFKKITLEVIRNNKVLYSISSSKGESLAYDYLKNPLPAESVFDQIPSYPLASIIIGGILGSTILYKVKKKSPLKQ